MFTVPRIWILGISSVLWTVPSFILLRNALVWSADLDTGTFSLGVVLASCGILLGYLLWFKRIVVANINRIRSLPERTKLWHISSSRGYAILALMVLMGGILRGSDFPRIYLAGPYALMGGCLLLGSIQMASDFMRGLQPTGPES